jgi:hypothetical protein
VASSGGSPPETGAATPVAELAMPLRFAAVAQAVFVTECDEEGALWRVDGERPEKVAGGLCFPACCAPAPDGGVLVACLGDDRDNGYVVRVDRGGAIARLASGLPGPTGIVAGSTSAAAAYVLDTAGRLLELGRTGGPRVVAEPDEPIVEAILYGEPAPFTSPPDGGLWHLMSERPAVRALVAVAERRVWVGVDGALRSDTAANGGGAVLPETELEPAAAPSDLAVAGARVFACTRARPTVFAADLDHLDAAQAVTSASGAAALACDSTRLVWCTAASATGAGELHVAPWSSLLD